MCFHKWTWDDEMGVKRGDGIKKINKSKTLQGSVYFLKLPRNKIPQENKVANK